MIITEAIFDPRRWYWKDAAGNVYSSASNVLTAPGADEDFSTWLARGNSPTVWPHDDKGQQTAASLNEVLEEHGLPKYAPK